MLRGWFPWMGETGGVLERTPELLQDNDFHIVIYPAIG